MVAAKMNPWGPLYIFLGFVTKSVTCSLFVNSSRSSSFLMVSKPCRALSFRAREEIQPITGRYFWIISSSAVMSWDIGPQSFTFARLYYWNSLLFSSRKPFLIMNWALPSPSSLAIAFVQWTWPGVLPFTGDGSPKEASSSKSKGIAT